ncbi:N-alpha-acetyltransferase 50 [Chytriomyces hyalinus]|nr:N-alpha-acetyltransferase 50 [Chytriomyces hyalinus]KAJ3261918.1 N-alpha-acetyltransferase 50 [Chytriomyces hyalinus]
MHETVDHKDASWASIARKNKDRALTHLIRPFNSMLESTRSSLAPLSPPTNHNHRSDYSFGLSPSKPLTPSLLTLPVRSDRSNEFNPQLSGSLSLSLESVSQATLPNLQSFNAHNFPVRYGADFYTKVLDNRGLSVLLVDRRGGRSHVVAALLARRQFVSAQGAYDVYIMTVGVDASFRRSGIASMLIQTLVDKCEREKDGFLRSFVLHVHVGNPGALDLYLKNGFHLVSRAVGYYALNPDVSDPKDAWVLTRRLEPMSADSSVW